MLIKMPCGISWCENGTRLFGRFPDVWKCLHHGENSCEIKQEMWIQNFLTFYVEIEGVKPRSTYFNEAKVEEFFKNATEEIMELLKNTFDLSGLEGIRHIIHDDQHKA